MTKEITINAPEGANIEGLQIEQIISQPADLEEKALGLDATYWMKDKLNETIKGDEELIIRTELKGGVGKYGRLLGWLYVGDNDFSLNEQMITEGYAWAYDGGTKKKNFQELKDIRAALGTYDIVRPDGTHEING